MDINDMDLDEFFGLEPEEEPEGEQEQEVAEPAEDEEDEGENEQEAAEPAEDQGKKEMSPEERHANAARRRAAELDNAKKAGRDEAMAEVDAFVKSLGLKDPYNGNRAIETKQQYDEYKKAQNGKALERGLSTGKLTVEQFNAAVDARIEEHSPAPASAPADPGMDGREEVDRQYAEIQALDPGAPSLTELVKDKTYMDEVAKRGSMVDAYKLTYFQQAQARQAQAGRRDAMNRVQEKAHLARTSTRGNGAPEVTADMRNEYRVFFPDITDDEIRAYESKDSKIRKK